MLPNPIGGGLISGGDIEFDDAGRLFLAANLGPSTLVEINQATGVGTVIGPMGFNDVFGLAFSGGTLFGFSAASNQVFAIDRATGAGFAPRPLSTTFPVFGAAAVTPEPATLAVFGLGLVGLTAVRRRQKTG